VRASGFEKAESFPRMKTDQFTRSGGFLFIMQHLPPEGEGFFFFIIPLFFQCGGLFFIKTHASHQSEGLIFIISLFRITAMA
jgi:hypothetical protein